jgi:hypothetical protein
LVASVSAKLSAGTHDIKLKKLADDASTIGQLATAFAQKTAEQDEIKTVAQVVTNLSPAAKKLLDDQDKNMQFWKERTDVANQQLSRLLPLVPKEAQAAALDNLPRESKQERLKRYRQFNYSVEF